MTPELQPFLDTWAKEWSTLPDGAGPAGRRAHFEIVAKNMRLPTPKGVDCESEHWIDSEAGKVRVRVFASDAAGPQPCLIYMHGGAFMQGSPETHWDITSRIAGWNGQTVISVDYAKAPENPFPTALDQVGDVVRWAVANAEMLNIDAARIAIGGDSAGANLAAATALDLRGEVELTGQLLIYPACDFDKSRPSYAENPDGPIVRVADMANVNAMYCPDPADLTNPRAAPLLAESHAGLPPAYVAVAEFDPLRDSGVAYAEALSAAGVEVILDRGPGLIHGYLRAMDFCADSMTSLRAMADWLKTRNNA
jgi:acetyl esterase